MLTIETKGKKIFVYWEGELLRSFDKAFIYKHLQFLRPLDLKSFLEELKGIEKKAALECSYALLAQKAYLSTALQKKIIQKGISSEIALEVVSYVGSLGYLDDDSLTERWIVRRLKKGYGLFFITQEMRHKGMSLAILEKGKGRFLEIEKEVCRALKEKLLCSHGKEPKEYAKVLMKLKRRGFSQIP